MAIDPNSVAPQALGPVQQLVALGTTIEDADPDLDLDVEALSLSEGFFSAKGTFYRVPLTVYRTPVLYTLEGLNNFTHEIQEDTIRQRVREEKAEGLARQRDLNLSKIPSDYSTLQRKAAVDIPGSGMASMDRPEVGGEIASSDIEYEQGLREQDIVKIEQAYESALNDLRDAAANEDRKIEDMRDRRNQVPVLMNGIRIGQRDIVSEMPCLANVKVFYVFGQSFGQVQVAGQILLGPLGTAHSDGVELLTQFFNKFRVSNYKKPVTATIAQNHYQVYVTGLMIGEVDPELHILPFGVIGTLLDPDNEGDSYVNLGPQVSDEVMPNLSDLGQVAEILGQPEAPWTLGPTPGQPWTAEEDPNFGFPNVAGENGGYSGAYPAPAKPPFELTSTVQQGMATAPQYNVGTNRAELNIPKARPTPLLSKPESSGYEWDNEKVKAGKESADAERLRREMEALSGRI